MNHPYAIPTISREQSSPSSTGAGGGGSTRSLPPTTTTTSTSTNLPSSSSGSVNRKLVVDPIHGHTREETREERRARKERERQSRDQTPSTSSSTRLPTSSSSSTSNTSTSSKSVLTIALQRAQSAVLLDSANNFPAAISAYSQSVRLLKEVMARVESKGLSGGTSAVEMERKGSTGSTFSILSSTSSNNLARRDSETVEEWEKRKSRWEKKEKAKADEARRLKVIHDTYEDRIKMLLAMNPSLASSVSPSIAAAVLPTSTSNPTRLGGGGSQSQSNGLNPSSPTTASMRFHRRRSSTELPQSQPQSRHRSTPSSSSATSVSASSRPNSPASSLANNLGQAMLSTDLASPISPHASNGIPRIAQLPIISPSNSLHNIPSPNQPDSSYLSHLNLNPQSRPLSTASDSTAKALPLPSTSSSSTSPSGTATPTSTGPISNSSINNLSRPLLPLPPPTSSLPPPPPVPDHPPPPIPTNENQHRNSDSNSSEEDDLDENGEKRIPVTALEFSKDWPTSTSQQDSPQTPEREELRLPIVDRDPLVSVGEGRGTTPPRSNIFPVTRTSSNSSSPMRRGSSASAVYTLQSNPARPPATMINEAGGGGVSSTSMVMRRTMSSEGPTTSSSSVLRPARSASLASQGQGQIYSSGMVPSLSGGSSNSSFSILGTYGGGGGGTRSTTPQTQDESTGGGLVSSTTAGGTISQRRLLGGTTTTTTNRGERDQPPEHLEATIVVRAPSQESYRSSPTQGQAQGYDEFGSRGGGGGGGGFGSLPGRLRALSQPPSSQKRPKLPINSAGSWISEVDSKSSTSPPLPPLLSQTPSSSSSTTHPSHRHHLPSLSISSTTTSGSNSANRKPLIPTPTSLNAPPFPSTLGRSNSSSSVGSSASGRYSDRSLPPPVPSTTPGTSLHSQYQTPSSVTTMPGGGGKGSNFGGIPFPPNRSSASSRETVLSIPPVRRPFHLMRLVLATMPSSNPSATSPSISRSSVISIVPQGSSGGGGGYLSEKLYVPCQVWSIPGSKLVSLETKVRMMEIVLSSLSSLSQVGQSLLSPALANTARNSGAGGERWCLDEAGRFMKELESFEGVVEGVQNTLSKKLGGGLINPTGGGIGHSATNHSGGGFNDREFGGSGPGGGTKDSGGGGSLTGKDRKGSTAGGQFASWSSKFQRGFDRVTNANGVSLDSQATYVDTIARLFRQSQCIDHHLALLLSASSSTSQSEASAYALLPLSEKHRLERQLRRASEFFGTVICRFVMKDVGLLLDKYVKRGGAWLSGE